MRKEEENVREGNEVVDCEQTIFWCLNKSRNQTGVCICVSPFRSFYSGAISLETGEMVGVLGSSGSSLC